ncbi:MAG: DUF1573 domain-containing protein [Bacteroidales bacterium]|nr:DUF1573 domain-containing protein [Bacteroidales bacterium]
MNAKISFRFISISLFVGLFFIACKHEPEKRNVNKEENGIASIKFDTTYYDFGNLTQGEKVSYTFKFKNTGTADLLIKDAYSTCGCTVPKYDKKPISPGKSGRIEVLFDSSGRKGVQFKTIVLKLNTVIEEVSLYIKANIVREY